MNEISDDETAIEPATSPTGDPLTSRWPDEPGIPDVARRPSSQVSIRALISIGLLLVSLAAVSAYSVHRLLASRSSPDDASSKLASDRPSAASNEPRRLDLAIAMAASAPASTPVRVPAIVPEPDELDPVGIRHAGTTSSKPPQAGTLSPVDAPLMLLTARGSSTRSSSSPGNGPDSGPDNGPDGAPSPGMAARQRLDAYQRQLQVALDNLNRGSAGQPIRSGALVPDASSPPATQGAGLFGGQLTGSATARAVASRLGDRSLTLAKGTAFTCALKTRVVSATSGLVGCQVQRNVYSDDGRVLLIERGSHMDGEYRVTALRPGTVRIPVLWTRIRTPEGVVVDIDSPGTGALGESGIDGHVDNRWSERIGAALLLSLVDDTVSLALQGQQGHGQADTVVLPATTGSASKLAEKVLDSTINIPPLIFQNQGAIVGIQVARDVDFSAVYELQAVPR